MVTRLKSTENTVNSMLKVINYCIKNNLLLEINFLAGYPVHIFLYTFSAPTKSFYIHHGDRGNFQL